MDNLWKTFKKPIEDTLVQLDHFWNFQVATIDGNEVAVSNIALALLIFAIGFKISKRLSFLFIKVIPNKKRINENTLSTMQSVVFYFLLIIFTFTSLAIAQIPLKSFALLGGALAIGFGFGSQNVIKNFISGIILMIEQPIRVGDIISTEGTEGRVIRIGARSTHIRSFDNVDILVPNSILLENNVINWTLSDDYIRTRVNVGVAYGTDTRKVEELLKEVTTKNTKVIKKQPVMVFLTEFGDNAINFEVQFWCKMPRPSEKRQVESNVRQDIYEAFKKKKIVIAFPQRDLHVESIAPIEVKMV